MLCCPCCPPKVRGGPQRCQEDRGAGAKLGTWILRTCSRSRFEISIQLHATCRFGVKAWSKLCHCWCNGDVNYIHEPVPSSCAVSSVPPLFRAVVTMCSDPSNRAFFQTKGIFFITM